MSTFFVNGKSVTTTRKQSLLRFLRDELKLTSVKDGCSQGACGACTVIIDGETCRACVPTTDTLEGRNIITVEGLTDWESKVYTYAYGEAGAVQCGFCIPAWLCVPKHCWIRIQILMKLRSAMPSATTTAAVPAM